MDLSPHEHQRRAEEQRAAALQRNGFLAMIGGAGLSALGLVLVSMFVYWAAQTYTVAGKVLGRTWRHTVHRQDWVGPMRHEDWAANIDARPMRPPVNGVGEDPGCLVVHGSCYDKYHHTDTYMCGRTCSGTGKSRHCRTNWCHRDVYRSWCAYDAWEWVEESNRTLSGTADEPAWPEMTTGELQRLVPEAEYHVGVEYAVTPLLSDKPKTYTHLHDPSTLDELRTWHRDGDASVVLRNAGWVVSVRPLAGPEQR